MTNVVIVVILKSGNKLRCNTNYLVVKLNQNGEALNLNPFQGKLIPDDFAIQIS